LIGRAIWVTLLSIFITSVLVVIFVFVPGAFPSLRKTSLTRRQAIA
jgi:hypothetical protein